MATTQTTNKTDKGRYFEKDLQVAEARFGVSISCLVDNEGNSYTFVACRGSVLVMFDTSDHHDGEHQFGNVYTAEFARKIWRDVTAEGWVRDDARTNYWACGFVAIYLNRASGDVARAHRAYRAAEG